MPDTNDQINCIQLKCYYVTRHHLQSRFTDQLSVLMVKLSTYAAPSFAVSRFTVCNNLPYYARNPMHSIDIFKHDFTRHHLQSRSTDQLSVLTVKSSTYAAPSFAVSEFTVCNNLPYYPRNPMLSIDIFKHALKTFRFA